MASVMCRHSSSFWRSTTSRRASPSAPKGERLSTDCSTELISILEYARGREIETEWASLHSFASLPKIEAPAQIGLSHTYARAEDLTGAKGLPEIHAKTFD